MLRRTGSDVFISYAHEDEDLRAKLEKHLKLLERQGLVRTWHDRRILPGETWAGEVDANLEAADVVLLLVSADFTASDYCWEVETSGDRVIRGGSYWVGAGRTRSACRDTEGWVVDWDRGFRVLLPAVPAAPSS